MFLRRRAPARVEVINDLSRDVATFFRILQRHYQAFLDMLKWQLSSRSEFTRLLAVDPETLTNLERAARFLYLQRTAFGSRVVGRTFGVSSSTASRFDMTKLAPMLEDLHERLAPVTIECLPYADVIRRYDRPDALFFLDPPYWNNDGDYGAGSSERADFQRLADQLATIAGQFISDRQRHRRRARGVRPVRDRGDGHDLYGRHAARWRQASDRADRERLIRAAHCTSDP